MGLKIFLIGKKGVFFTLIVIYILSLFFISYSFYSSVSNRNVISKRIETMNNFIFSMEEDLEREIYAFGFRAVFLAEGEIINTGTYVSDLDGFVEEAFKYCTVDGDNSEILNGVCYDGTNDDDLVDKIRNRGDKINVDIYLNNPEISIFQEDPWTFSVLFSFDLIVEDKAGLSSWDKHEDIKAKIKVTNFEDPIYLIGTGGVVANKINQTIYEHAVLKVCDNFHNHVENSYYQNNSNAPSFLKRLEGDLTADENGIESFVYVPDLITQGITPKSKSWVDYIYFSDAPPENSEIGCAMPSGFKIDSEHKGFYNLPD